MTNTRSIYKSYIMTRRSGKTVKAVGLLEDLPNSVLVAPSDSMVRYIMQEMHIKRGKPVKVVHNYSEAALLAHYENIIFDEPSIINESLQKDILDVLVASGCNVYALGSLNGRDYILNRVKHLEEVEAKIEAARAPKSNRIKEINEELESLIMEYSKLTGSTITNISPVWHHTMLGESKILKMEIEADVIC